MRFVRLTLTSTLLLGALALPVATASARTMRQIAQGDRSSRAALAGERQRVRGELERANADINALKQLGRSLRRDYRLRGRLADAEALARRLMELDARLGVSAPTAPRSTGAEPRVSAADGPAEREAKADILADQAQRLASRGDALLGRVRDLRARQTLRLRVGQMERDPFSPLEGSKRRAMTGSLAVGAVGIGTTEAPSSTPTAPTAAHPSSGGQLGIPAVLQPVIVTSIGTTSGSALLSPVAPPTPTSSSDASALSVQLRDLVDPATLAEIQHLERRTARRRTSRCSRAPGPRSRRALIASTSRPRPCGGTHTNLRALVGDARPNELGVSADRSPVPRSRRSRCANSSLRSFADSFDGFRACCKAHIVASAPVASASTIVPARSLVSCVRRRRRVASSR
jgi:hypothetical protein